MSNIRWKFPSSNGGEKRGLNDSGIETFKDTPIKSLAREICQNSLDASHNNKAVRVEFNSFSINKDEFPDRLGFDDILESCKEYWSDSTNNKTRSFFSNALSKIRNSEISFLRISDFNTTGLRGSNSSGASDWDNLVNSSGASEKDSEKGGSFGIGKNAPFACSEFRTVFYSTYDVDGVKASKGVSKLTSFKLGKNSDGSDDISQGTGYYGIDTEFSINNIEEMLNLDNGFIRNEHGTDIFISGFSGTGEDFKASIISEVLDGFLIAIWEEKLEVVVNSYTINKSSLGKVVSEYNKHLTDTTIQGFELLNKNIEWHNIPIELTKGHDIGSIKLAFDIRHDGSNKVSMIRSSGMKIMDRPGLAPSHRFNGIAIIQGIELNRFLRDLENPAHTRWMPERYERNPVIARGLIREIFSKITDKLNEIAFLSFNNVVDIEGAGDYLPDELDEDGDSKEKSNHPETLNKIIDIEFEIHKHVETVANLATNEIGTDLESELDASGYPIEGRGSGGFLNKGEKKVGSGENVVDIELDDLDENYGKKSTLVKAKEIRIFCINKEDQLYRLLISPTESSVKGYIEINRIAEQNEKMPIMILSSSRKELNTWNNCVGYFPFTEGVQISLDLKLDTEEYSTMEVKLYAYKG